MHEAQNVPLLHSHSFPCVFPPFFAFSIVFSFSIVDFCFVSGFVSLPIIAQTPLPANEKKKTFPPISAPFHRGAARVLFFHRYDRSRHLREKKKTNGTRKTLKGNRECEQSSTNGRWPFECSQSPHALNASPSSRLTERALSTPLSAASFRSLHCACSSFPSPSPTSLPR